MTVRLVAEGIFAHLWVYLVCTGFVLLGLLVVSKAFDELPADSQPGFGLGIHWWHFIGSPLLLRALGSLAIRPLVTQLIDCPDERKVGIAASIERSFTCYKILIYVLFCTIGFVAPFTEFREIKLLEDGIADTQAPGWASINCTADETPESIDVRTDLYSYFVLADPHWRVASENYTRVECDGDKVVAPIVYDGPVDGCQTKYPLFAVCIDTSENISSQCGWGDEQSGAWTQIRLMTASPDIELDERKEFWEEWVPNPYNSSEKVKLHHENLFQFNTPSYDETVAYLEYKRNQYDTLKWKGTIGWFCVSAPVALLAFLLVVRVHVEPTSIPCSASEVSTCSDIPPWRREAPTVPGGTVHTKALPSGSEDEEMSTLPAKDDDSTTG